MTVEMHGVVIKSPSGRFLTPSARCAIRLEVGLIGTKSKDLAVKYGCNRQRVERLTATIPSTAKEGVGMADVIAAARTCWKNEDGRQGSEAIWTLVLLDALALLVGDAMLSSSTLLNKAIRGAAVAIDNALKTEAQHVG